MEIIIHRGTHQIGGCVTEIKTEEARIIIDMGTPLPGSKTENETGAAEEEVIALPGVTVPVAMDGEADKNENAQMIKSQPCDAVFITVICFVDWIRRDGHCLCNDLPVSCCTAGIVVFTGYRYEDLVSLWSDEIKSDKGDKLNMLDADAVKELLELADILIDGPFVLEERDLSLSFRGSRNQRVIDLNKTRQAGEVVIIPDPERH